MPSSNQLWAGSLAAAAFSVVLTGLSGAAETSIKLGNTAPYSGPASAYGTIARAEAAYFQKLNDEGGVNGRRIEFLTLDEHEKTALMRRFRGCLSCLGVATWKPSFE